MAGTARRVGRQPARRCMIRALAGRHRLLSMSRVERVRGPAERTSRFTESVIREMTRLHQLYQGDRGVNLAQGFPDFPAPAELKEAAKAAIDADLNQYAVTWGTKPLRDAIAAK